MKRQCAALALAALLLPLSGCKETFDFLPYGRELDDMALMRTMGVDTAQNGVEVTVSSGAQDQGGGQGEGQPTVLRKEAGSISAACLSMQAQGVSYVFYGHVGQFLLGEELARNGVEAALDYVLRDIEMRLESNLYLIRGSRAGDAIEAAAQVNSATDQLESLEADAGLLADCMFRTVEDVMEDLAENGDSFAPALTLNEAEGQLETAGYGLLRQGALAGWAEGESARGVNLLMGWVDADVLEVEVPDMGKAALRVVGAKTQVRPVLTQGTVTGLALTCKVDANLAEGADGAHLEDPTLREALEAALEERCKLRLEEALDLCRTLDGDFFQLKTQAGLKEPWHWAAIQAAPSLADLDLQVQVEGRIQRGYNVRDGGE